MNSKTRILSLVNFKRQTTSEAPAPQSTAMQKLDIFVEQIIDSSIVAGIAGISAYLASDPTTAIKAAGIAFAIAFLVKMKEYRNING